LKLDQLTVFPKPVVVEKPACDCCKAFAPECLVPMGDGAMKMCWLCAHAVVEHDVPVDSALHHRCKCSAQDIYPATSAQATRWEQAV
jgi:hypothetical protein